MTIGMQCEQSLHEQHDSGATDVKRTLLDQRLLTCTFG